MIEDKTKTLLNLNQELQNIISEMREFISNNPTKDASRYTDMMKEVTQKITDLQGQ